MNMPWHILAPSAVACDNLHFRASAHLRHVSAFLCNREFLGIFYCTKKDASLATRRFPSKMVRRCVLILKSYISFITFCPVASFRFRPPDLPARQLPAQKHHQEHSRSSVRRSGIQDRHSWSPPEPLWTFHIQVQLVPPM